MKTVFLSILKVSDKATALLEAIKTDPTERGKTRFELNPDSLSQIPTAPFSYWLSEEVKELFILHERFSTQERFACNGASTCDDFRYTRLWTEPLKSSNIRWHYVPYNTGSKFSRFLKQVPLVVPWDHDRATFWGFIGRPGRWQANPVGSENYFRAGITWPLRGSILSAQALPAGCSFSVGGKVAIAKISDLPWLIALLNSEIFDQLVGVFAGNIGGVQYESGLIERIPVPALSDADKDALAELTQHAWLLKYSLDTTNEIFHAFTMPQLLQVEGYDLIARSMAWSNKVRLVELMLAEIQAKIDLRCFDLYGIDEVSRHTITEGFGFRSFEEASSGGANDVENDAGEDPEENEFPVDTAGLAAELISWTVGVALGRFDVRLAIGVRPLPTEPKPFDPLPNCSPGMLTGDDGLPLARPPADYPLTFPESGVLIDDPGHAQDLTAAVRTVFDTVFDADADRWWQEVSALLDPKGHDLRSWLAGSFFEQHIKRYSKTRRKAPILWQLGTPSGRYSVWLYAHRLSRDSFFQLQNQGDGIVALKLAHEERQLTNLIQMAGGSPSAAERKELATQEAVVEELRTLLDEIRRVAPLWNPNLDDGVVLIMAPLWRLVPQHKPWQKELKAKWDELVSGKYDWAHLAMHLWPERVVPKCATDRSLAIAHGLEEVFWVEDDKGKWQARPTPVRPVEELVRERSSTAVKAALKSLLDAGQSSLAGRRSTSGRRKA